MSSIEDLTEQSRAAILANLLDMGRSCTPQEYVARTEIATLTAERDKLKEEKEKLLEVLRPFANALRQLEDDMQLSDEDLDLVLAGTDIRISDLRAAAALIKELTPPPSQKE